VGAVSYERGNPVPAFLGAGWMLWRITLDLVVHRHLRHFFGLKLSGNEVDCTNASLLLLKIMLCSKLHCIKVFNPTFSL
jgi:hypothetical protein